MNKIRLGLFALSMLVLVPSAYADAITISWDSVTQTGDGKAITPSYKVWRGIQQDNMTTVCDTSVTTCTIDVDATELAYYAVTAYTAEDGESAYSDIVGPVAPRLLRPMSPANISITIQITGQ